jgi:hypothetical protein
MEVPTYEEHWESATTDPGEKDENGEWIRPPSTVRKKYTVPGAPYTVEGYAAVAQISTTDNPMTVDIESNTAGGTPPTSGATYTGNRGTVAESTKEAVEDAKEKGKDKKGGKDKKAPKVEKAEYKDDSDKTKVEDEIERYYFVTNAIEDLERELDKLSNAKDDAWGPNRLVAMDKEIAKLKQVRNATKQYKQEIEDNLVKDTQAAVDVGAQFENGIISNRNELVTQWVNELNAVKVDGYNAYED